MLSHNEAFAAGYLPALCGAYFNLVELFATHGEHSCEEVRAFIAKEMAKLRETGVGVIANVRRVERLALLAGFEAPQAPRFPKDYRAWFSEVHNTFYNELALHEPPEICFRTGFHVGTILARWNLMTVAMALLALAAQDNDLQKTLRRDVVDIRDTLDELRITAKHPNGPESLWELALLVTDCMDYLNVARHVIFKKDGSIAASEIELMTSTLQQQIPKIMEKIDDTEKALGVE